MRARQWSMLAVMALTCAGCAGIRPPRGVTPSTQRIVTTGYCACGKCCGWHRNWLLRPVHSAGPQRGHPKLVGRTASGAKARRGTIAADTSVYPFGTVMHVPGYGYGRVEDRGGAIKGQRLDLFFPRHSQALEWGRRAVDVRIWRPR